MGAQHSKALLYGRLVDIIPPPLMTGTDSSSYSVKNKGQRVFADEADRDQFIHALFALLSANTSLQSLVDHDFKLLYSRRAGPTLPRSALQPPQQQASKGLFSCSSSNSPEDDGSRLVATLVAIDAQGIIRAKIEPEADGKNIAEAFRAFRRDVEGRLADLLRDVPSGVGGEVWTGETVVREGSVRRKPVGERSGGRIKGFGSGRGRLGGGGGDRDAPPAYGDVKTGLH